MPLPIQSGRHFTLIDYVWASFAVLGAVATAAFTVFVQASPNVSKLPLLFLLLPGIFAGLFITGFHGGTATQETLARIVGPTINALFYAFLLFLPRIIWRSLRDDRVINHASHHPE